MKRWPGFIAVAALIAIVHPSAKAGDELLTNAGFESPAVAGDSDTDTNPADWILFSSVEGGEKVGLSSKARHNGKQSARLTVQGTPNSYQGIFQSIAVASGSSYQFTVHARNDNHQPLKGTARGQISIEWKAADDQELDRTWGPDWGASLAGSNWTKFEMVGKAPPNAVRAHFVITQFDGADAGAAGTFLVDDASVKTQPDAH
jgi:hypothetical protein